METSVSLEMVVAAPQVMLAAEAAGDNASVKMTANSERMLLQGFDGDVFMDFAVACFVCFFRPDIY